MHFNNLLQNDDKADDLFDQLQSSIFMFDNKQQQKKQQNGSESRQQSIQPINFFSNVKQFTQIDQQDQQSFLDSILNKDDGNNQSNYNSMQRPILKRPSSSLQDSYQSQKINHHQDKRTIMDKMQMNRIYTKNYRLKKKQQLQSLKQQNKFLKQKIDDLTFRLHQAQLQINKLKHSQLNLTTNFTTMKQQCIRQLQLILSADDKVSLAEVCDLEQKFRDLVAYSNKPRLDMLNYLMSELLENLVTDQGMYFIQCLENRTGIWRESEKTPMNKLDYEILEILSGPINENQTTNQPPTTYHNAYRTLFAGNQHIIMRQLVKIKILWKKLYQDYIDIINQGLKLETVYRPLFEKKMMQKKDWILTSLKFKLFFQKNKYRKDVREIRQRWFREILEGNVGQEIKTQATTTAVNPQKRCKMQQQQH